MTKLEKRTRKILDGRFIEGERVTVNIDGREATRKVKWSKMANDLYIRVDGRFYFYCEFVNEED